MLPPLAPQASSPWSVVFFHEPISRFIGIDRSRGEVLPVILRAIRHPLDMPRTCADLEIVFGHERPRKTLAAQTYRYIGELCARIRSPHERMQLAQDLMQELYIKLKRLCVAGEIGDLDAVIYVSIRRDIGNHCKKSSRFGPYTDQDAEGQGLVIPAMSHEQFDRAVDLVLTWLDNDRDKMLLEMHVDGRSNPEMSEAGGISDRQVTRLRVKFNILLVKAWKQLYS